MEILDFEKLPSVQLDATIVTVGNFDGVHAGHQELIRRTVSNAKLKNLKSVVVTFFPHPTAFFQPDRVPLSICSKAYKEKLINSLGIDALLTLGFNDKLAALSPEEYVKTILVKKLNPREVWIGYDFTFGKNRKGNARVMIELAEKYGFQANILQPQRIASTVISSTRIREYLLKGEVEKAATLLNRKHTIQGFVVGGNADGRKLGFPTINIDVKNGLLPGRGIYSGIALVDGKEYAAAIYIGFRPTYEGNDLRVEAHLLKFAGDLYGKCVSLGFLKFHRGDIKFENICKLKVMIKLDCDAAQRDVEDYKFNHKKLPLIW